MKRKIKFRGRKYEYRVFLVNNREFIIYAIDEKEVIKKLEEELKVTEIRSITKIEY